jgi:hypothetical protein
MIPSPERGDRNGSGELFTVRSVARYRGLEIHVRLIPGLTPGAIILSAIFDGSSSALN